MDDWQACVVCGKMFDESKGNLQRHMRGVHGIDTETKKRGRPEGVQSRLSSENPLKNSNIEVPKNMSGIPNSRASSTESRSAPMKSSLSSSPERQSKDSVRRLSGRSR